MVEGAALERRAVLQGPFRRHTAAAKHQPPGAHPMHMCGKARGWLPGAVCQRWKRMQGPAAPGAPSREASSAS